VFLFKNSEIDPEVNNAKVVGLNFCNFTSALIVLFRCSTGEDWHKFMYHYSTNIYGKIYFLFFITLSSFIMLNMFTLVVTQQFEIFYFNPDNPISSFQEISDTFLKTWNAYTWKWKGTKIRECDLVDFFSKLASPLGYRFIENEDIDDNFDLNNCSNYLTIIHRDVIAQKIFKMDLPSDSKGFVPFGVVLHSAIRNAYGKKYLFDLPKKNYCIIREVELRCLAEIMTRHNYHLHFGKKDSQLIDQAGLVTRVNPFLNIFYIKITFKCWYEMTVDWERWKAQNMVMGTEFTLNQFFEWLEASERGSEFSDDDSDFESCQEKFMNFTIEEDRSEDYDSDSMDREYNKIFESVRPSKGSSGGRSRGQGSPVHARKKVGGELIKLEKMRSDSRPSLESG
jgi:hypothetical protein